MELVQLSSVVSRVAERAYSQLTALVKTSRRQAISGSRRRDLSDYCRLMANTFLRLLALLRWLQRQHSMQGVLTASEFLHRCDVAVCHVVGVMRDFQVSGLDRVRAPALDLTTAVTVLSTGNFLLPACLNSVAAPLSHVENRMAHLDELLRTRLVGPDDADALMTLMQKMVGGGRACSIVVAAGVVKFCVGDLFDIGVTIRSARGSWILCWCRVLVQQEREVDLGTHALEMESGPELERQLFHFLNKHFRVSGVRLSDMLTMMERLCLSLIYRMYVREATDLLHGRFAGAIDVDEQPSSSSGQSLRIRYWRAPTLAHALSMQIDVDSGGLRVQHFPALPVTGLRGDEGASALGEFHPGRLSFERLLLSTMRARAAERVWRLRKAIVPLYPGSCVSCQCDASGFFYLEAKMSAAVLQLRIRRENGLFALTQVGGCGNESALSIWQVRLNHGCGVFDVESAPAMLNEIQRRLLLEKIAIDARAFGCVSTTVHFERAAYAAAESDFASSSNHRIYMPVVPVALALTGRNFSQALKFFLSLSISEDHTLRAELAAVEDGARGRFIVQAMVKLPDAPVRISTSSSSSPDHASRPSKAPALDWQSINLAQANDGDISEIVWRVIRQARRAVLAYERG